MTRFKELQRIESAIEHADAVQLHWAQSYCVMRIGIAATTQHKKYWEKMKRKVEATLEQLEDKQRFDRS